MTMLRLLPILLMFGLSHPAAAQSGSTTPYPNRPIKVLHGFSAGGPPDTILRLIARQIEPALGAPVVVDNRPGASGTIAAASAARAEPDGYTLLFGVAADMAVAPATMRTPPYDPVAAFTPIVEVARGQYVLLVRADAPPRDLKGLVAWARQSSPTLNYASPGIGTVHHLATEALKRSLDIQLEHIPYRAGLYEALLRGDVQVTFESMPGPLPYLEAGKLVALAVTGTPRLPALPAVATLAEQGVNDVDVSSWWGFVGPAGVPPAIVVRLNSEIARALAAPEVRTMLEKWNIVPSPGTPEAFGAHIVAESQKWKQRVQDAKVPLE